MSHPTAISPEEQEQIARQIGVLLLQGAPEDWQQITVEYRATGEYHDLLAEAVLQDGSAQPWEPPEELLGIFEHLREGMYRPDVGTWLSALYIVERPSSYRIDINFDEEPQWQQPLPRAAYADELRRYPRSEDNVPDWMRDKLDGTTAPSPQTPASEQPAPAEAAPASAGSVPVDAGEDGTGPLPRTADAPAAEASAGSTHAGSPAAGSAATGSPDGHFRTARVFDGADEQGRPLITTRLPIPPEDSAALRQYLENAPVVLAAQGNEPDQLDPNQPAVVPGTWHTDGVWLWQGAVAYYLAQYGVPPEPELVEHARSRRFGIPEIDSSTRDSAASVLLAPSGVDGHEFDGDRTADDQPVDEQPAGDQVGGVEAEGDAPTASASSVPEDVPTWEETTAAQPSVDFAGAAPTPPVRDRGDVADEIALDPANTAEQVEADERDEADAGESAGEVPEVPTPSPEVASVPEAVTSAPAVAPSSETAEERDEPAGAKRHGRPDEDDEVDSPDADLIFDDLKDRLDVFGVDRDSYVIGARGESTWSLHDEGSDWVVAGPAAVHGPVHFERPEQAAAFLLGSLLMARDPGPAAPVPEAEPIAAADPVEDDATDDATGDAASAEAHEDVADEQPDTTGSESPAPTEPPTPAPEPAPKTGGNFLFTANETREAEAAENEAPADPSLHEQPAHGQAPVPGEIRPDAQPPVAPPPPIGQPAQAPPPAAPAANGAPPAGQVPPPLPKRTPRGEPGAAPPPPAPTQQPPAPPAPGGAQGPDQRRGPAGPSAPGAPPRPAAPQPGPAGAANRPPQGGTPAQQPPAAPQAPNQQAPQAPQQAGQQAVQGSASDQPIQPLHGEPPLTLFRDRRTIMLQPGTDMDRFGEPNGNVLYAARTPYNQRSLPPQWANRNYFAYRVQRPLQVLRGTAVPWFEQPGGGTAYVLPAAVGDLVADGTLVALSGADAPPRPPME